MPSPHQDSIVSENILDTSNGVKEQSFNFIERFKAIRTGARDLSRTIHKFHDGKAGETSILNKSEKLAELIRTTPQLSGPMYTNHTLDRKFGGLESAFAATYIALNILNNSYLGHADFCYEGLPSLEAQHKSLKTVTLQLVETSATMLADAIRNSENLPDGTKSNLTKQLRGADLIDWWATLGIEKAV